MSDVTATATTVAHGYFVTNAPAIAYLVGAAVMAGVSLLIDGLSSRVKILRENPWLVDLFRKGAPIAAKAAENAVNKAAKK